MGPDAEHAAHRHLFAAPGGRAAGRDDLHHLDLLQPVLATGCGRRWRCANDRPDRLARRRPIRRRRGGTGSRCSMCGGLVKHFGGKGGAVRKKTGVVRAVDGIDFSVRQGRDARHRRRVRAAANRRRRAWSCRSSSRTAATIRVRRRDRRARAHLDLPSLSPPGPDGVPGQLRLAQPAADGGGYRRVRPPRSRRLGARRRSQRRTICCTASASNRPASPAAIRTRFPAGSVSASTSPARCRCSRAC